MLIPWRVYFDRKKWMLELDTSILVCWVSFFWMLEVIVFPNFLSFQAKYPQLNAGSVPLVRIFSGSIWPADGHEYASDIWSRPTTNILWLDESPTCWELTMAYPLDNERMSPENQWLEDVFPIEIYRPFFWVSMVSFRGCTF